MRVNTQQGWAGQLRTFKMRVLAEEEEWDFWGSVSICLRDWSSGGPPHRPLFGSLKKTVSDETKRVLSPEISVKLWGCEAENEAQMLGEEDRGGEERRREGIPKWLRVLVWRYSRVSLVWLCNHRARWGQHGDSNPTSLQSSWDMAQPNRKNLEKVYNSICRRENNWEKLAITWSKSNIPYLLPQLMT